MQHITPPLMLGNAAIDRYCYDEEVDVLYLKVGPPQLADDTDESLEGDTIFFDASGEIVGVTMIGPRHMIERDGTLNVTLPSRGLAVRYQREVVEPLLHETIRY